MPFVQDFGLTSASQDRSLLQLQNTIFSYFETDLTQCPVYLFEIYEDSQALMLFNNTDQFSLKNGNKNLTQPIIQDAWSPFPLLEFNGTLPVEKTVIYLKGQTMG